MVKERIKVYQNVPNNDLKIIFHQKEHEIGGYAMVNRIAYILLFIVY